MKTPDIQYNADDFGISKAQSQSIVDAARGGVINAASLLMNSPALPDCLPLLEGGGLRLAVHLNVTEGKSLSDGLTLLTDSRGYFCRSFFQLALWSLTKRAALKAELTRELEAQLLRFRALLPDAPLRVDGHQHVQMLPLVLRVTAEICEKHGWRPAYIRCTAEPLGPYLRRPALWGRTRPVNWLKNLVLNACAVLDRPLFRRLGLEPGLAMGLVLSGDMTWEPVHILLPDFIRTAQRRGKTLELVIHPGVGLTRETCLDPAGEGFVRFCTSENRAREAECVRRLKTAGF